MLCTGASVTQLGQWAMKTDKHSCQSILDPIALCVRTFIELYNRDNSMFLFLFIFDRASRLVFVSSAFYLILSICHLNLKLRSLLLHNLTFDFCFSFVLTFVRSIPILEGHCPSGDNPYTAFQEQDCQGISQIGGIEKGRVNNLCQVDCSNRGICDYSIGQCTCFEGSWGQDCSGVANVGDSEDYLSGNSTSS